MKTRKSKDLALKFDLEIRALRSSTNIERKSTQSGHNASTEGEPRRWTHTKWTQGEHIFTSSKGSSSARMSEKELEEHQSHMWFMYEPEHTQIVENLNLKFVCKLRAS